MILILVRHGEVDYAQGDNPALTEKGMSQAFHVGLKFKDTDIDALYTSDLHRAVQTGTTIARHHDLDPIRTPSLREFRQPFTDREEHKKWAIDEFLHSLSYDDNDKIIMACHGHVIRYILSKACSISFSNTANIQIFPGSVTIVKYRDGEYSVITVNSYQHIPSEIRSTSI